MSQLPPFLVELVNSCPPAGDGVNHWMFQTGRQLHAHLDERGIFNLLRVKTRNCGRLVTDREILRQIRMSRQTAWRPDYPEAFANAGKLPAEVPLAPRERQWPKPDLEAIRAIVALGLGLHDLWERSPVRFDDTESHAEEVVEALFPANPLLCVGQSVCKFATRRRDCWRGHLHRFGLIVPNPMLDYAGHPEGEDRLSQHTKEATARRVYLVVEFDFSIKARDGKTDSSWASLVREWAADGVSVADACAALHWHLSSLLPLVLVVHSGGKSLHGWFYVFGQPETHLRVSFMNHAIRLGADKATWVRSQFSRLPDGRRENGRPQRAFYFDPAKTIRV